jgi:bifunctional DNA-binding transcriptional regulator/antitoxin component of YhaV-PrlF toxin-antitoxin module
MKTAISIPDSIFEEAERLAKQRGLSRSEMYARAVDEYVRSHKYGGVRERIEAVYEGYPKDSELDSAIEETQASASRPEDLSRIRVRKSGVVVTIPPRIAALLRAESGGFVEAEATPDGVLLKPLPPEKRREALLDRLHALQRRVRPSPETAALSPEEQEEAIADILGEENE